MTIKRGELYYADLSPVVGSGQGGIPRDSPGGNKKKKKMANLPTNIDLPSSAYGLVRDSVILLEQIRTLDKRRLKERIGELNEQTMSKVDKAILISLGFAK